MLDLARIRTAAQRLHGVAHRTPLLTSRTINSLIDGEVFFKAECLQRAGAFKFRGAYNAIAALPQAERARGVVAWSSGNHAQAVALAARIFGVRAVIVMPKDAPQTKLEATRGYGAEVVQYDRYTDNREAIALDIAKRDGLAVIPAYDHFEVMAGQGTAALELLEEVPNLDSLLVPVGGGGLISGCATASKALAPGIEIFGVEPKTGDDVKQSFDAGRRISIPVPHTVADGLQVSAPGELTFEVIKRLVTDIVLVEDAKTVQAMRFLFERMKLVVEPSGAIGLAALLDQQRRFAGKRVGIILSGGNVGAERFCELLH
jgi:threonine dehydratase